MIDNGSDLKHRVPQANFTVHDARYIKKVVHQPCQMVDLPVYHFVSPLHDGAGCTGFVHHVKGISNRSERVTEFMAEHGEKFILTHGCMT